MGQSTTLSQSLVQSVAHVPLICPHGHVDPQLFSHATYRFGSPVELLIIPDHYIFRMLYSRGIALEALGIASNDPQRAIETDHRKIWQTVADHWYLFSGTPSGIWIRDELRDVFGITERLNPHNAQDIYTTIDQKLQESAFTPRHLYQQFNIEVLATTDSATDTLAHHQAIASSDWTGRIIPTFRPDAVVNIDTEGWLTHIETLSEVSGVTIHNYASFIHALETRRTFFKQMGAKATDHAALTPYTTALSPNEVESLFQRALAGRATDEDATRFTAHMLMEMARMSLDDGLVMQLHVGSFRNHNPWLFAQFGRDKGADIPVQAEFTRNLHPLLSAYGNDPRLTLILFTLDETTYSRELAPLAGHYPAVLIGPPWWFHDSWNGMHRYFEQIVDTAGLYNTAGFNDDTRAFLSIPARHAVWRKAGATWLSGLVQRGDIDENEALTMMHALTYDLAKHAYRLDSSS